MKIGLISDVHAAPEPVAEAIRIFRRESVDRIICAGDIAGYNYELDATIELLLEHDVECIIGNHDLSWLAQHVELEGTRDFNFLARLPLSIEFEHEGVRVLVVHAEPPDGLHGGIKLLDIDNHLIEDRCRHWRKEIAALPADVLIVGHTHQVFAERLGRVLVINPGSSVYNHSCMILELPSCKVHEYALQGEQIKRVWNWGMQVARS